MTTSIPFLKQKIIVFHSYKLEIYFIDLSFHMLYINCLKKDNFLILIGSTEEPIYILNKDTIRDIFN